MTIIAIVVAYMLLLIAVGVVASRKVSNDEDFVLAKRSLGPILLAAGLAATEVGGGSSLGIVQKAYGQWGLSSLWYVLAMAITFTVLAFVAPSIRGAMVKTVPEFFRRRYGEPSSVLTAIIMILPMAGFTAAQIIASSAVLSVLLGWSYHICVLVVTVVVVVYSVLGGMFALAYTDIIQWVIIILGMAAIIPFALHAGGGWHNIAQAVPAHKWSATHGMGVGTMFALTITYIASFCVGQEVTQRYYSAKSGRAARQASLITAGVYVLYAAVPALIGVLLFGMAHNGTVDSSILSSGNSEYALPVMAMQVLPSAVTGLLFAALISATMSSASSDMMAAGTMFANDIYKPYIAKKDADQASQLKTTRLVMIGIGAIGGAIALLNISSIITILVFSFALRASGAFLPYVVGHFWDKANEVGAILSLVLGSAAFLLVDQGVVTTGPVDGIYVGLLVSACVFFGSAIIRPSETNNGISNATSENVTPGSTSPDKQEQERVRHALRNRDT